MIRQWIADLISGTFLKTLLSPAGLAAIATLLLTLSSMGFLPQGLRDVLKAIADLIGMVISSAARGMANVGHSAVDFALPPPRPSMFRSSQVKALDTLAASLRDAGKTDSEIEEAISPFVRNAVKMGASKPKGSG